MTSISIPTNAPNVFKASKASRRQRETLLMASPPTPIVSLPRPSDQKPSESPQKQTKPVALMSKMGHSEAETLKQGAAQTQRKNSAQEYSASDTTETDKGQGRKWRREDIWYLSPKRRQRRS
ncbi:hypothetical protein N7509_005111 [Penicillium cosmopolitanum]|uniref:Uncharacterized protein n=1 Tax=Penicillium cosmopolitanum TaxID=1131564 RepID=A0A9W9W1J8_9EURO|nr:uncharacterized protein N7509_005111 [Penicillium cosmopolitanum]KAJ5396998.1 hypothetical protein N7509_005111 [Penicillium cosmopolitanum]